MNYQQICTFILVAETGSFYKAAQQLLLSDVAVIKRIKALEEEFSTTFFFRGKNGCTLTDEGSIFLRKAIEFKRVYNDLLTEFDKYKNTVDTLKIGYDPDKGSDFLIPLLKIFSQSSTSKIRLLKYSYTDFFDAISECEIDVAFMAEPSSDCPKALNFHKIVKAQYYAMYRKENNYFDSDEITLDDLKDTIIYFSPIRYNKTYDFFLRKVNRKQLRTLSIIEFVRTQLEGIYITTGLSESVDSDFKLVRIKDLSSWWGILSKENSDKNLDALINATKALFE